jgi:hypothetical protein
LIAAGFFLKAIVVPFATVEIGGRFRRFSITGASDRQICSAALFSCDPYSCEYNVALVPSAMVEEEDALEVNALTDRVPIKFYCCVSLHFEVQSDHCAVCQGRCLAELGHHLVQILVVIRTRLSIVSLHLKASRSRSFETALMDFWRTLSTYPWVILQVNSCAVLNKYQGDKFDNLRRLE